MASKVDCYCWRKEIRSTARAKSQKKTLIAAEQSRRGIVRRRAQWCKYRRAGSIRPELVFIDETWTKANMAPVPGWAPRGQQDQGQRAAWPLANPDLPGCIAPRSRHSPMAHRWANQWRVHLHRQSSCPTMDNLGSHRATPCTVLSAPAGARLFLPKYSPDLNPDRAALLKTQTLAEKGHKRSADDVCDAIGQILKTVSATECSNYFEKRRIQTKRNLIPL